MNKKLIKEFIPPIFLKLLKSYKKKINFSKNKFLPSEQKLDLYYDPEMAKILDVWGERNAWIEIQHILHDKKKNKVLDIACGTGIVIEILSNNGHKNICGCDISDFLIQKAINKGIEKNRLLVCDATSLPYKENEFDYNYSIGSLEHFTKEGIKKFLSSSMYVTKFSGYHMIPVSRDNKNYGWIENYQSYFNNSIEWWSEICSSVTSDFYFIDSSWEDEISIGKWLIINKKND